jgi:hypothetical protein
VFVFVAASSRDGMTYSTRHFVCSPHSAIPQANVNYVDSVQISSSTVAESTTTLAFAYVILCVDTNYHFPSVSASFTGLVTLWLFRIH